MKAFACNQETIVQTPSGALQGYRLGSTYTFLGVQYATARRFEMPQPTQAWDGVKTALHYGDTCLTMRPMDHSDDIIIQHREFTQSENCLNLNVWTQSIAPGRKRPVMVWFHGGAFSAGSSIELMAFEGGNLSEFGDVVVVSVNHRLNILGYFDLSPLTDRFPNSANAGSADLIAALKWVQENISCFGGDPENVTVFGQSGGGHKTFDLLQIAAADGLYHKLIIQSGVTVNFRYPDPGENGKEIALALLKELNLDESQVEQLQSVPYRELAEAFTKVQAGLRQRWIYCGETPLPNEFYRGEPTHVGFRAESLHIPVMAGTVLAEFAFQEHVPNKESLTEDECREVVRQRFGQDADRLIAAFQKAYPDHSIADVIFYESTVRHATTDFLDARLAQGSAPVYCYVFALNFPIDDGRPAWHCADLPFTFHNTDKIPVCGIPGVATRLERKMCSAWVSFAESGVPSPVGGPAWRPYTAENQETMIFDRRCRMARAHDRELVALHEELVPAMLVQS